MTTVLTMAAQPSKASPVGLDFELPQRPKPAPKMVTDTGQSYTPLAIPTGAGHPPTRNPSITQQNSRVYQTKAAPQDSPSTQLPPPPPGATLQPSPQLEQATASAKETSAAPAPDDQPSISTSERDIALAFPTTTVYSPEPSNALEPSSETTIATTSTNTDWIFEGGENSLVARVVGSAEGTRTPTGQRTRHYNGHRDPGNGVWNLGTFSYQHGAASPEEADAKQLARLSRQEKTIDRKAQRLGLQLSLIERLNALDLANQSPAAALNPGGYIDRLYQAQQSGKIGDDAILWARTYSYMNPNTQRWNAPGLGNTYASIRRDQNRRLQAIASALDAFQMQQALAERPNAERPSHDVALEAPQSDAVTPDRSRDTPTPQTASTTAELAPPHPTVLYTAPGNTTTDPLNFDLAEKSVGENTISTASSVSPLITLQRNVDSSITASQADRILNRVRSLETNIEDPMSSEP